MTDRDRLIELLRTVDNMRLMRKGFTECADYLLAKGVIVPPVSVGQTVYIIDTDEYGDYPYALDVKISSIGKDECGVWVKMDLPLGMKQSGYIGATDIGKTVFLTKEEAEQALAERSGDNE